VPVGILEIGLGATLVPTSGQSDPVSTLLASAWALLGGFVLVADALVVRRRLIRAARGA
jgi:hypothetical protein